MPVFVLFGLTDRAVDPANLPAIEARGIRQMSQRSAWFSRMAPKAPHFSSLLLIVLGLVFVGRGIWHFV